MSYYRIIYKDELYHHGVKGMKWGVRKADYNTQGMRSRSIYDRLDDLEDQEIRAYSENRKNYRAAKKQIKGEAKTRIKEARAANKDARKAYNKSFSKAYSFSQRHAITTMLKKHDNYKKNQDNWADALKKAEAANAAKKNLKDVKARAKADVKSGKAAARDVLRKNEGKIERDFDKAYYKTIGESYIKRARATNAALEIADIVIDARRGVDHDDYGYRSRQSQLDEAERRRNRYEERQRKG